MILEDNQLHTSETNRLVRTLNPLDIDVDLEYVIELINKNANERSDLLKLEPLLDISINTLFEERNI